MSHGDAWQRRVDRAAHYASVGLHDGSSAVDNWGGDNPVSGAGTVNRENAFRAARFAPSGGFARSERPRCTSSFGALTADLWQWVPTLVKTSKARCRSSRRIPASRQRCCRPDTVAPHRCATRRHRCFADHATTYRTHNPQPTAHTSLT